VTSACLGTENVAVDGVGRFDNWCPTAWLIRDLQLGVDDRLWIRRLRQPQHAADYRIVYRQCLGPPSSKAPTKYGWKIF